MPSYGQLFSRKETHPLVIDVALLRAFGPEWMTWDSDSTSMAVERQFGAPSRATQRKIDALSVLHANHAYWHDWRAFEVVSWALSGREVSLVQVTPVTVLALMYGRRVARWIDAASEFSDEVKAYIVAVFIEEQYSLLPPEFSSLQEKLFERKPELRLRADAVKAAILSGSLGHGVAEPGEDPVKVEVTRHRVLESMLRMSCSAESVLEQAQRYGLRDMVAPILEGAH